MRERTTHWSVWLWDIEPDGINLNPWDVEPLSNIIAHLIWPEDCITWGIRLDLVIQNAQSIVTCLVAFAMKQQKSYKHNDETEMFLKP